MNAVNARARAHTYTHAQTHRPQELDLVLFSSLRHGSVGQCLAQILLCLRIPAAVRVSPWTSQSLVRAPARGRSYTGVSVGVCARAESRAARALCRSVPARYIFSPKSSPSDVTGRDTIGRGVDRCGTTSSQVSRSRSVTGSNRRQVTDSIIVDNYFF